jgi:hypothetical protein
MKGLSIQARAYVLSTIVAGSLLFVWNLKAISLDQVWMIGALTLLASVSLIFKVTGTRSVPITTSSSGVRLLILFAGRAATMLVIVISNVAEWIVRSTWYIQCFNITSS